MLGELLNGYLLFLGRGDSETDYDPLASIPDKRGNSTEKSVEVHRSEHSEPVERNELGNEADQRTGSRF